MLGKIMLTNAMLVKKHVCCDREALTQKAK